MNTTFLCCVAIPCKIQFVNIQNISWHNGVDQIYLYMLWWLNRAHSTGKAFRQNSLHFIKRSCSEYICGVHDQIIGPSPYIFRYIYSLCAQTFVASSSFCDISGKQTKQGNFSALHNLHIIILFACYWAILTCENRELFVLLPSFFLTNSYATFYLSINQLVIVFLCLLLFCNTSPAPKEKSSL